MITNKDKTPYAIYIQEGMENKEYGVNQDEHVRGMVKYVRSDYVPNHSEMLEIAKKMTFNLDDRLCPYDREGLRARAWLEGYTFAKRNWEYSEGVEELINGCMVDEPEQEDGVSKGIPTNPYDEYFACNTTYFEDKLCDILYEIIPAGTISEKPFIIKKAVNKFGDELYKAAINDFNNNIGDNELIGNIKLRHFIDRFSHNNEVFVENKDNYQMYYKYRADQEKIDGGIMDWELNYTDISDCNVIRISNVIRDGKETLTIVVDTDKKCFNFLKEKVSLDNSPMWLYEKVHDKEGGCIELGST